MMLQTELSIESLLPSDPNVDLTLSRCFVLFFHPHQLILFPAIQLTHSQVLDCYHTRGITRYDVVITSDR